MTSLVHQALSAVTLAVVWNARVSSLCYVSGRYMYITPPPPPILTSVYELLPGLVRGAFCHILGTWHFARIVSYLVV